MTPCIEWTGALQRDGYGSLWVGKGKTALAHRVAYEAAKGPIPSGLTLDHLCRNRRCVNPDHLEPVTNRENILRGVSPSAIHARKTHCPRGHAYDETNTRMRKNGARACLACNRLRWAERGHQQRIDLRAARRAARA